MSRILRRPMFRGGHVSSYGTGIASGLADGGMPPKRGLVDGPGGYGGEQSNWQKFLDWTSRNVSGNENISGAEIVEGAKNKWMKDGQKIYGSSSEWGEKPTIEDLVGTGYGGGRPDPDEAGLQYLYASGDDPDSESTDVFMKEWINEDAIKRQKYEEKKKEFESKDENKGKEFPDQQTLEAIEKDQGLDEPDLGLGGSGGEEILKVEKEPGKILDISGIDDPTDIGEGDLAAMISKYEEQLGMKKARGQDISDMLLSAGSKFLKEGATVKSGFGEFLGEEAKKGPGRSEKIKQAAAMLGIKYEQAKDIAAITALGKRFSPGITEKTARYIKGLEKGSPEHATALAQIKWPSTLDRKITEAQMTGEVTLDSINVWAGVYIDDYKGKLTEDSVDGVFLNTADGTLVWVDEKGEIGNTKQLNVK
jgi:hypothetical protein